MAIEQDLSEIRGVAVTVIVDRPGLQRLQHGGDVVGGQGGAEQVGGITELPAAARGDLRAHVERLAHGVAVDRLRQPRAALVDDDDVAMVTQAAEQGEITEARSR